MVPQLRGQLARSKDDLLKKDEELSKLAAGLETRLEEAEHRAASLESELATAKAKQAEQEAHLLILQKEKERK